MVSCPLLYVTCGGVGADCASVGGGAGACCTGGSGGAFLWRACGFKLGCGVAVVAGVFLGEVCEAASRTGRQSPTSNRNANPDFCRQRTITVGRPRVRIVSGAMVCAYSNPDFGLAVAILCRLGWST